MEKEEEKVLMEEVKKLQPRPTQHLPLLLELHLEQVSVSNTTLHTSILAKQTFYTDQTSPNSWINISKTYNKGENPDAAENNLSIIKKKKVDI